MDYVVSSSNRVGVWAKYLVALSGSFDDSAKAPDTHSKTSSKRKRLHILYLLNDLFHHTKYHSETSVGFSTLTSSLQPYIVELLGSASSYDREKNPKHHRRLDDLLDIWDENGYYSKDYVNKLREVVKNSALTGPVKASIGFEEDRAEPANKLPPRDVPFVMPPTHGDSSTPYYDLPAGNLVPHIIPNSASSLRPDSIKPLQFLAGPADGKLVDAVKVFLHDADRIYGSGKLEPKEDEVIDIDELGQTVIRDALSGEIIDGETYYGWSRGFCQQMKKRNRSESRSPSRSRSRSLSPDNRRRRYSSPRSDDSRRLGSRSRSRSPPRRGFRRNGSYSRSRSRPRRRSPSREKSYSPPPSAPRFQPAQNQFMPPNMNFSPPSSFPPAYPPMPYSSAPGMPPAPPPPPPNYQGQWPPPPPPMSQMNYPPPMNSAFPPPFQQGGFFPPPHMGQQQMPPGSRLFPPPHSGSPGPGPWSQAGGYPPGGRGWR